MNDDLNNMSDDNISKIFAVEVAGWAIHCRNTGCWVPREKADKIADNVLCFVGEEDFATSMDAVLPYLEKHAFRIERLCQPDEYCVYIELPAGTYVKGCDSRLSKAACIALIMAARSDSALPNV
jgi:hypothetical protein